MLVQKTCSFYHYFYKSYLILIEEEGFVLLSTRPFGEMAERRASRGLWSRGREQSEKSECVSASVCASASARAYVQVHQRERVCERRSDWLTVMVFKTKNKRRSNKTLIKIPLGHPNYHICANFHIN